MAEFNGRPDEQAVIVRLRSVLSPTVADAERVKVSIAAALAAGTMAGAAASARAAGAGGSVPAAWGVSKLSVIALTALLAGGAGYLAGQRAGRRAAAVQAPLLPATVVQVPAGAVESSGAAVVSVPIALVPASGARTDPASVAPPTRRLERASRAEGGAGAPVDPSLDQEVRALRSVERALRDRQPGLALAVLAALDRDVPGGKLVEEREAMLVIARCAQADAPIRVELDGAFAGRYPGSVYLQRVQQACGARSLATVQRIGAGAETDDKQEAPP